MTRAVKRPVRKFLRRRLASASRVLGRHFDLVRIATRATEAKFFRADPDTIAAHLDGTPLRVFDVGARDGVEPGWDPYRHLLDITLAEPDPTEGDRLRAAGYRVTPALVGGEVGTGVLNICVKGGSSSTLEPLGPFHHYYAANMVDRFTVKERIELPMTTVAQVVAEQGAPFDYLKLDTQGSEASIIRALGPELPIIVKSEISWVPIYQHSSTFAEIAGLMQDLGYITFHLAYDTRNPPDTQLGPHPHRGTGIPMHGDAWFCPDWTRPEGQAIWQGRDAQYRALLELFGLQHAP